MGKSAMLVMDIQNVLFKLVPAASAILPLYKKTIAAARAAGIPIIYVVVKFRPGHPDLSSRNKSSTRVPQMGGLVEGDTAVEIHPDVAPERGDVVVTKRRVSAFSGTDLEVVLRSLNVDHLVLTGIATSGAVLSTLRQAADLDYQITVLEDLCYDTDSQVHTLLMEKVFNKQGAVKSAEEWAAEIET